MGGSGLSESVQPSGPGFCFRQWQYRVHLRKEEGKSQMVGDPTLTSETHRNISCCYCRHMPGFSLLCYCTSHPASFFLIPSAQLSYSCHTGSPSSQTFDQWGKHCGVCPSPLKRHWIFSLFSLNQSLCLWQATPSTSSAAEYTVSESHPLAFNVQADRWQRGKIAVSGICKGIFGLWKLKVHKPESSSQTTLKRQYINV